MVRRKGYPHLSKVFDTEDAAAEWGDGIEEQMRDGTYDPGPATPPPETIHCMLQRYWEEVSPTKAREGDADEARIKRLQKRLGRWSVHRLTSRQLTQYKRERLEEKAAAQTVLHELVLVRHAYRIAIEDWGLDLKGPVPKTRRPKLPPGRKFRIKDSELKSIRLATGSRDVGDAAEFAVESCMRRGEILALGPYDVSLDSRRATLVNTKNGESRTVPLTARAVEILRPRVEVGMDPLFPIKPQSLSRGFCRAVRQAGYRHLRFHDTRHEGISRLFEQGYGIMEVIQITGHKTLSQLLRYTHLDVNGILEKMQELEDAA